MRSSRKLLAVRPHGEDIGEVVLSRTANAWIAKTLKEVSRDKLYFMGQCIFWNLANKHGMSFVLQNVQSELSSVLQSLRSHPDEFVTLKMAIAIMYVLLIADVPEEEAYAIVSHDIGQLLFLLRDIKDSTGETEKIIILGELYGYSELHYSTA
ncbi:hypothetical protein Bca4012_063550 [Brassica carinata]